MLIFEKSIELYLTYTDNKACTMMALVKSYSNRPNERDFVIRPYGGKKVSSKLCFS